MAIHYSARLHAFLDDTIHATLPDDAVAITAARHAELLAAQGEGALIVANAAGRPQIRRRTANLADRRAAMVRQVKREAARRIEAISPIWQQLNDMRLPTPSDSAMGAAAYARFTAIDAVRAASDIIEDAIAGATAPQLDLIDISNHPAWPASVEDADA
ncbi:hypothetical protein [Sphingobium yanoikuyae]|uniref:Uncharacterized protein n=1 Tax=Sphingobium yanoikuyae TaxID=13690 RepID=A0A430BCF8_SPHYA|nr:hypothetical protein [Sphingobium yanoikuyae]RSU46245.1 hypothetical protein DAH51_26020 [Sphingobium yanoikuyae]WBQ15953.1 hypothetical protein PAE53_18880 [Sphingobium yanoikuyae]